MDVVQDIFSVDDLGRDPREVLARLNQQRRPMMITVDGKPAALLLSPDLFPTKKRAMEAAVQLKGTAGEQA